MSRNKYVVAASVLGLVLTGGGFVASAQPSSEPRINGCVNRFNGNLRVLDPPGSQTLVPSCNRFERPITWNQNGQPGPAGPPGPEGPGLTIVRNAVSVTLVPGAGSGGVSTSCPANHEVLGGGFEIPALADAVITGSHPAVNNTVWQVDFEKAPEATETVIVHITCIPS